MGYDDFDMNEYEKGTVFKDDMDGDVDFFTVVSVGDNTYTIVELWKRPGGSNKWQKYSRPKSSLALDEFRGFVKPMGRATDEELEALDKLASASDDDDYRFIESVYNL